MPRGKTTTSDSDSDIANIIEIKRDRFTVNVLGTSPLVLNRMSEKARRTLLFPNADGPKTAASRQSSLKHDPVAEFQASPYTLAEDDADTFLAVMASAFKGALKTAALDMPGAKKTQIGRLVYVEGEYIPVYGEPQLYMAIVRGADMNHTPDVRTRAILRRWACKVSVTYAVPILQKEPLLNLLGAAGITAGIGDGRPEKGSLNFGQYRIVGENDPEFLDITQTWGRTEQIIAMETPVAYDNQTDELLTWFENATKVRGFNATTRERRVS